jgi:dienelactone hydrolase
LAFETFAVEAQPPIPVERVRLRDRSSNPVTFLLLHGYGANRRQLLHLTEVLAAAGAEVFVPDLPGRGDHDGPASPMPPGGPTPRLSTPRETEAALRVVNFIEQRYGVRREQLVVVGHSLGGGVAIELGRLALPVAVVSLAGLERPVARGGPRNLLLITATLEIPPLRAAADRMYENAHVGTSGLPTRVERRVIAATHTSLPFHAPVQRALVEWANPAVPEARLELPRGLNSQLLMLELASLFFLSALFVPLAALGGRALPREAAEPVREGRWSRWSPLQLFGYALLAGAAAVSLLRSLEWLALPGPLGFLRLAEGDYLASTMLLATLWLAPLWKEISLRPWRRTAAGLAVAVGLAAYLVVAGGGFLTWQLFDLWPTPSRWIKLAALALALCPFAIGEATLRRSFARAGRGRDLTAFLLWRAGLLAAVLYAALVLDSGQGMLLLMTVPLLLLSLVQYYFLAVVERTVGGAAPAAVLNAVLAAWIIATIAPLR